jgi:hypothetical protein
MVGVPNDGHDSPITSHHSLSPAPLPRLAARAELREHSLVSTVPEIKEAIAKLSPEEYCELMAALRPPLEDDEWDEQMKADAEAGRLDFIDREIEQAKRDDTLIPLERILAEDRPRE